MLPNQKLNDDNNIQVALFPLLGFIISQAWYENFSHDSSKYYATDFLALNSEGIREFRAPCYAPVDIILKWKESKNCLALWQSLEPVHFADNTKDYLGIIVYHDNDIQLKNYSEIGTIKKQGEIFNRTGTGGNVTGDHIHLEVGKGQILEDYLYHFTDNTSCKRIKPDEALFVNDTIVTEKENYNWKIFEGGVVPPEPPEPSIRKRNSIKWLKNKSKKIRIYT